MAEADECRHELPPGQCADCKPPPEGVKKVGYRTRGGAVFHNDPDCALLANGQQKSARLGRTVHTPERISWVDAQTAGLGRCLGCCVPRKPCWVNIDGTWLPGELVWIGKRDSQWWANVSYDDGGRRATTTKSQQDIRRRP